MNDKKIIHELFLNNLISPNKDHEKLFIILDLIKKYDSINEVKKTVENHVKLANLALASLIITQQNKKYFEYLQSIIEYSQNRIF